MPAEIRNQIYNFTLDLTNSTRFHASGFSWDRVCFVRSSRQIFTETATTYFELKLLPHQSITAVINWIPDIRDFGCRLVLPLTPSQFRFLGAIAMDWYRVEEWAGHWGYCPFEPMRIRRLIITRGPGYTKNTYFAILLRKWLRKPSLEISFERDKVFEVMNWVSISHRDVHANFQGLEEDSSHGENHEC
jgi:hypothetical protein